MAGQGKKPASKTDPAAGKHATDRHVVEVLFQHARLASIGIGVHDVALDPVDWPEAARIVSSSKLLALDSEKYRTLSSFLANARDRHAETIREAIDGWVRKHWPIFEEDWRSEALKLFEGNGSGYRAFEDFIDRWPQLASDSELLADVIEAFDRDPRDMEDKIERLRALTGPVASVKIVIDIINRNNAGPKVSRELASLIAEWAGKTAWGELQYAIWRADTRTYRPQAELIVSDPVKAVAAHLAQLGLTTGSARPGFRISDLSAETRAAWRRSLRAAIGTDLELREAVTEALLWFGRPHDDRDILFTVLELHPHGLNEAMESLCNHPSEIVQLRAKAVLDLANGEPDAAELLRIPRRVRVDAGRPKEQQSVTWIGDPRIEGSIKTALGDAAREFGEEVRRTVDSGEETHVAILFERLRNALREVTARLAATAAGTDASERLELKLEHRIVGKHEEGGKGVGTARFSTDVCLIFEARYAGAQPFARRASFLQAKRLHRRGPARDVEYYPVDRTQLQDLAGQTLASFLLLIGPTCEGISGTHPTVLSVLASCVRCTAWRSNNGRQYPRDAPFNL
ncbi:MULTISPECIES: hypothetical protein [unclassified Bradyrhizobium]|uniref:hypothetical protein n=1 Tax=unclassified Bradyrhizobium TaxID=2631580 RepID=UPI00291631B3|nr:MULTISPECIES: hypothetical protein [unclassified Bradyrhizobium]